jgi:hypothetical protein
MVVAPANETGDRCHHQRFMFESQLFFPPDLVSINLDEAAEIIFYADGGKGIWPKIDTLIS